MLLALAIAPVCLIFVLISDSLYAQVMPILSLIDGQNSQKAIFSFEKGFSGQNHSSPGSHHLFSPPLLPPAKNSWSSPSLNAIWKTLYSGFEVLVLALLTSWKISVQHLKMCFCLQMLVDFDLMNLMMVEMVFYEFSESTFTNCVPVQEKYATLSETCFYQSNCHWVT